MRLSSPEEGAPPIATSPQWSAVRKGSLVRVWSLPNSRAAVATQPTASALSRQKARKPSPVYRLMRPPQRLSNSVAAASHSPTCMASSAEGKSLLSCVKPSRSATRIHRFSTRTSWAVEASIDWARVPSTIAACLKRNATPWPRLTESPSRRRTGTSKRSSFTYVPFVLPRSTIQNSPLFCAWTSTWRRETLSCGNPYWFAVLERPSEEVAASGNRPPSSSSSHAVGRELFDMAPSLFHRLSKGKLPLVPQRGEMKWRNAAEVPPAL